MTIEASGTLHLEPNATTPTRSIASEFGGPAPYSLTNYYRGGPNVPNTDTNEDIPTSGSISMSDFYGSQGAFRPVMTVAIFRHNDIGAEEQRNYGWLSANLFNDATGIINGFGSITNNIGPFIAHTIRGIIVRTLGPAGSPRRVRTENGFEMYFNGNLNEISLGFYSVTVNFGGSLGEMTLRPSAATPGDAQSFSLDQLQDAASPSVQFTRLRWDIVGATNETVGWDDDDEIPFFFVARPPPSP